MKTYRSKPKTVQAVIWEGNPGSQREVADFFNRDGSKFSFGSGNLYVRIGYMDVEVPNPGVIYCDENNEVVIEPLSDFLEEYDPI